MDVPKNARRKEVAFTPEGEARLQLLTAMLSSAADMLERIGEQLETQSASLSTEEKATAGEHLKAIAAHSAACENAAMILGMLVDTEHDALLLHVEEQPAQVSA